jgi:hypothetical protein
LTKKNWNFTVCCGREEESEDVAHIAITNTCVSRKGATKSTMIIFSE